MERAFGPGSLAPNYTLVAFHAPLLFAVGIIAIELVRAPERAFSLSFVGNVSRSIFSNALVIGIILGLAVNVAGTPLPGALDGAVSMVALAALPAALFGLGAVLYRYRPEGDMRVIVMVASVSLIIHPAITWTLGTQVFALSVGQLRAAVLTAAMAPGVNAYMFANMYGAAKRVAASSVLICTALSIFSAWAWLGILP